MKANKLSIAATVIATAAMTALSGCGKQDAQVEMPAPVITVGTVDYSSIDLSKSYPATIKGKTDIEIRPLVSGNITQVLVDEGQKVKKGQTLFVLDQVQFQAAVDQARAAVNSAETAVKSAEMTANQKQALFDKDIISAYENQLAQNDLAMAKAQLATARAALTTAQKNLAYTVVTAPSDGVVGSIPFREGSLASPSMAQPLTTVSDNSQVYAYFSLTEKDLLDMTQNGTMTLQERIAQIPPVNLRLANGEIFGEEGKVMTVSGVIGAGTGAATVRALFNNENGMLRSGSTGQVIIPMNSDSVFVIPQKATFELQNLRFVYVVNDSNKVHRVPITVDPISDGHNFVVTSGLNKGDRIALEGVGLGAKLSDGTVIQPVTADEKQAAQAQQAAAMQQQGK